jgi:TRAP-type mannitol/chloroaromatic compound transport system permease small subunit
MAAAAAQWHRKEIFRWWCFSQRICRCRGILTLKMINESGIDTMRRLTPDETSNQRTDVAAAWAVYIAMIVLGAAIAFL